MKQPKNETETHFMLKEIAKYILWGQGYTRLATEVHDMYSFDLRKTNTKNDMKSIIDVAGVKKIAKFVPHEGYHYHYAVKGFEAKATLSDYKNGFCAAPAHTCIIAPKGIIPVELIPEKIGLVEVDFEKLRIKKWSNAIRDIRGAETIRPSKRRIDSRFQNYEHYKKWCAEMLEIIAYRCSHELLFWRNAIELAK